MTADWLWRASSADAGRASRRRGVSGRPQRQCQQPGVADSQIVIPSPDETMPAAARIGKGFRETIRDCQNGPSKRCPVFLFKRFRVFLSKRFRVFLRLAAPRECASFTTARVSDICFSLFLKGCSFLLKPIAYIESIGCIYCIDRLFRSNLGISTTMSFMLIDQFIFHTPC